MANTVTVNTLTKMNIPWHWWFWQKSHQATTTNYNMEDKSFFKSYTEVFSLHNYIRMYFHYIIIVLKEIKSVLMMATETFRETMKIYWRKKVVTDKFIHNLVNFSDEKRAKVQKVYILESQYFIVPSQHLNINCMWLTTLLIYSRIFFVW